MYKHAEVSAHAEKESGDEGCFDWPLAPTPGELNAATSGSCPPSAADGADVDASTDASDHADAGGGASASADAASGGDAARGADGAGAGAGAFAIAAPDERLPMETQGPNVAAMQREE